MSIKKGNKVIAGAPLEPVWGNITGNLPDQEDLRQALSEKAELNSPIFTGIPLAPSAPADTRNNQIATTKFVQDAIEGAGSDLPEQQGHAGQFLTTNGTLVSWATVDALPSQSGNTGKFLTTNGTAASWANIDLDSKVDKVTSTSSKNRFYIVTPAGVQSTLEGEQTGQTASTVPIRTTTGTIRTATPTDDNDATTKKYVDDGLKEKLDGYNISVAGAWTGGVHAVKFVTVDYSDADSENGVFIRISMVNSHGNGITGRFYQDIILNVNYTGIVAGTIYRYFAEPIEFDDSPYYGKDWGDVFWTIDTTNKIVKFFVLMRQYSYTYETPYFRLNTSTKGEITQHSGVNSEEYSSGTQNWATIYDYNEIPVQTGQSGKFLTTDGTTVSWATVDALPSQTSQNGKFLTTNGTTASWANIPTEIPSQSGQNGKFLTTNGSAVSWATVDAFPTQAGNNGKFLTTDGSTVSWADTPSSLPSQSGNNGKFLTTNGTTASWASLPTYSSGTGITVSGTTINHSNSVTAGTAGTSSATSGSTLAVPYVTYDAQGHVTASGTHTHTITGFLTSNDIDQTYSGTSTNAQSGVAVKSAIDAAVASVYKPAGSVAFANKPTLSSSIEGNVYNITDDFTTTADFVEGTGHNYPAGTNIVCINTATSGTAVYKWDVLAGFIDLSGYVKLDGGSAQQTIQLTSGSGTTALGVKSRSTASYIAFNNTSGWIGSYGVTSSKEPTFYNGTTYTLAYNIGTGSSNGTISANGSDVPVKGLGSAAYTSSTDYVAANSAITAGTATKITYDSKGLVTAGSSLSASDIPDISATYQTKITSSAKLSADLISDGTTNKTVTATEKSTWSGKQDQLVSGTNIKTINNTSILGSGNIDTHELPSQSGNTGKFLTTDGSTVSWSSVPSNLPGQTGQSGKFLTTDGSSASWANVPTEIPSQSGQSGKYLSTDGSTVSWTSVPSNLPSQTGQSGKFLTTDGTDASWASINALQNTATGTNALTILGTSTNKTNSINIGINSSVSDIQGVALGYYASTASYGVSIGSGASNIYMGGIAIGYNAHTTAIGAIQLAAIGNNANVNATNSEAGSFYVALSDSGTSYGNYKLLGVDGKIPDDRLNNPIPLQTSQSGKFLTTNGTTLSWAEVDALPSQSSQSGKFLTTNGTTASWADIPTELPSQSGQNGKVLTTNGSAVSWTSLPTVDQTYSGTSTNAQSGVAVKSAIDSAISSVYKPAGSVAFASLPTPASTNLGNVYNMTDSFTTDSRFVEGAGKSYPAGTNVVIVDTGSSTYKFDVLAGFIDLSGYQLASTAVKHTASTAVGNSTTPVYVASDGTATALSYTIAKSVPSDAVFTDTTYSVMTGAGASTAGTSGLTPAPSAGDNHKYLKGDGTWNSLTWTYNSSTETLTIV